MADNEFQDVHDALGIAPTDPQQPSFWSRLGSALGNALGPSWADRAMEQSQRDQAAYARGGVPEMLKDISPDLAEGFGGGALGRTEAVAGAAEKLSGSALKAVYESAWKKGEAPFSALADHVEQYAGSEKTPFNYITSDALDVWKHEMGQKYGDWAALEREGGADVKPSPGPVASESDISDAAIAKKLAANPGASIFDVSGVHVSGPSEKYTPTLGSEAPTNPGAYSREIPFDVPERAKELGFTTPAVHGTRGTGWVGPEDQLRLPEDQLGVHFGNPKQAMNFSVRGGDIPHWSAPRTYPVVLQMQNPLEMKDLGSWQTGKVVGALHELNAGTHKDIWGPRGAPYRVLSPEAKGQFPASELDKLKDIGDVRDYLSSKGYDSVKYVNAVEDTGHPSYILFNESPVQRGSVIGARSPFAQFDPKKLHLPSLAAGVGALSLYPFRGDEERKP